jgi:drug/metabolite transporter (DMT)-like permease
MQPLRGIVLKLISVTLFAVMASLIKATSGEVPPGEAAFFRSFFAIPVILIWLVSRGGFRQGLMTKRPWAHVGRGIIGATGMVLGFAGLGMLPFPEVTAIGFATPILVVVLAALFLGEKVRLFRISAVLLGLLGVLIVLSPTLDVDVGDRQKLGAIVVLTGALFGAAGQVFTRFLVRTEHTAAIVFYFSIMASLLTALSMPFGWVMPTPSTAIMLILAGLFGGVGQLLVTSAFRYADVSVIAPFQYASMLFALLIGYFIFDEVPTLVMLSGAALVIAAGVLIVWREHKLGLERGKARSKMSPPGS